MNFSLLLTDEEYQQLFIGKQQLAPYIYELYSNGQILVYFGVRHSRNPDDAQWEKLKTCWTDFSKKAGKRRIILLEGGQITQISVGVWQDTVRKFGEAGALLSFACGADVLIEWPDLSIAEEARQLMKKFEHDLVAYYIFARSVGSWLRGGTMGTFDEVLSKAAEATSRRVLGAPSDVVSYKVIHKRIFEKPIDETQKEVLIRASAPVYRDSVINDIARASSRLRNEHIVGEVERYWLDGYSIFILFGSAHAIIQEPALRAMINK